ncbi:hypothetical protein SAMN05421823_103605 [Catalinimonas alkaloidigena]|uniref:Long-chain fatty acid transport protein n=1 Tax=Catalinimonas alkaloidigena TaxID=1075417 RepID=A0A1G9EWE9_9BACT|nr:hypothetical protein [Catalinimonas alkaloidigena]SDK80449.1 hypothetical protein SAMN05421823_103605 [Catalinimonas alkaloidigena]
MAQIDNPGNAPYSRFGIGELTPAGLQRNMALGQSGVASGRADFVNVLNPALLYHNSRATIFESSLVGQQKKIVSDSVDRNVFNANLAYITFAFPVLYNRGALAVGIAPYSNVDYNINLQRSTPGDTLEYFEQLYGSGGLNRAFVAGGSRIGKQFSVGFQVSYIFGNIETHQDLRLLTTDAATLTVGRTLSRRVSDLTVGFGAAWQKKLFSDYYLSLGATYDLQTDLKTQYQQMVVRKVAPGVTDGSVTDTLPEFTQDRQGAIRIPASYRGGFSFSQVSLRKAYWSISADYAYREWSNYQGMDGNSSFQNSYLIGAGAEWSPARGTGGLPKYYELMVYRLGFSYEKMPLVFNNTQLDDIGINFGLTFPVNKNQSGINVAFTLGQRGTASNNLLQEKYFRCSVGFTLSDSRWFRRYKLD